MLEKIRKMKNKKGFTLVELIVVLVILAILAALLVPALTGYIDKAREQSLANEASLVLTAAQATVSEAYGNGNITVGTNNKVSFDATTEQKNAMRSQIKQLAEVKDKASWAIDFEVVGTSENYKTIKITGLSYSDGANAIVYTYNTDTNTGSWGPTLKKTTDATASGVAPATAKLDSKVPATPSNP
ncbi:type II secretion system protein [Gemmiger sp.]